MATPRIPLPDGLAGRPFTVAQAREAGVRRGRLRSPDLGSPLHGVRCTTSPGSDPTVLVAATAAALVLPGDVAFSHCTAAAVWGMPLPQALEHVEPLHVMRPSRRNPVRRPQVSPHPGLELRQVSTVSGLRVVSAVDTWVDLGDRLGVEDLVVVGDWVARRAGTSELLARALARRGPVRVVRRLREALRWVRVGADSPMETRARLVFVRHALPEPELNVEVMAADGSGFLCRSDFLWRRARVIGEYQGEHHFTSFRRGDDDISRRLLAEDDGWKYLEITKSDLSNPARRQALVARLAHLLGVEGVADGPSPAWEGPFATPSASAVCRGAALSAGRRRRPRRPAPR
ncbi:hypothetical protein [Phycicoccus ginsengisoli]